MWKQLKTKTKWLEETRSYRNRYYAINEFNLLSSWYRSRVVVLKLEKIQSFKDVQINSQNDSYYVRTRLPIFPNSTGDQGQPYQVSDGRNESRQKAVELKDQIQKIEKLLNSTMEHSIQDCEFGWYEYAADTRHFVEPREQDY